MTNWSGLSSLYDISWYKDVFFVFLLRFFLPFSVVNNSRDREICSKKKLRIRYDYMTRLFSTQ